MDTGFTISQFVSRFLNNDLCLEEIKRLKYPGGIFCLVCNAKTKHYKLSNRTAYACKFCRNQVYPLSGTIFEKTTTPLVQWFYAMFLMTQMKGDISVKDLQEELGVTYKTAWRIASQTRMLMEQNNGDLLSGVIELNDRRWQDKAKVTERRWVFFNKLEIKFVEKKEPRAIKEP